MALKLAVLVSVVMGALAVSATSAIGGNPQDPSTVGKSPAPSAVCSLATGTTTIYFQRGLTHWLQWGWSDGDRYNIEVANGYTDPASNVDTLTLANPPGAAYFYAFVVDRGTDVAMYGVHNYNIEVDCT